MKIKLVIIPNYCKPLMSVTFSVHHGYHCVASTGLWLGAKWPSAHCKQLCLLNNFKRSTHQRFTVMKCSFTQYNKRFLFCFLHFFTYCIISLCPKLDVISVFPRMFISSTPLHTWQEGPNLSQMELVFLKSLPT